MSNFITECNTHEEYYIAKQVIWKSCHSAKEAYRRNNRITVNRIPKLP